MLFNNAPFIASIPEHVHYGTVGTAHNLKCHNLETQVKGILSSHDVRGFIIIVVGVKIQLKEWKHRNNYDVPFNVVSREENVPKSER